MFDYCTLPQVFVSNIQIFCNFKCVLNTVLVSKYLYLVILNFLVFVGFLYITNEYDSHVGTSTKHCVTVKNCAIRFFIFVYNNKYKNMHKRILYSKLNYNLFDNIYNFNHYFAIHSIIE